MSNVISIKKTQDTGSENIELLLSKDVSANGGVPHLSRRIKFYLVLLLAGVVGAAGCSFAMFNTGDSAQKIQEIGLNRVANSLENVLSILAYPVLLFTILIAAYACQQIFKEYRLVNNPKTYGRSRKREAS